MGLKLCGPRETCLGSAKEVSDKGRLAAEGLFMFASDSELELDMALDDFEEVEELDIDEDIELLTIRPSNMMITAVM